MTATNILPFSDVPSLDNDDLDLSTLPQVPSASALLNQSLSLYPRSFHVAHINAQSLPCHIDSVNFAFSSNLIHAVGVSETWLSPSLSDNLVQLPGYRLHRVDRVGRGGGGVGMYVRSDLRSQVVYTQPGGSVAAPEMLFVSVSVGCLRILVCTVYCPPRARNLEALEEAVANFSTEYDKVVILGDFNINLLTVSPSERFLRNLAFCSNMKIIDLNPTHHHNIESESWIDHIIVSDSVHVNNSGQVPVPEISKHDLIFVTLSLRAPKPPPKFVTFRNFRHTDMDRLKREADDLQWDGVLEATGIDEKVQKLNNIIIEFFDRHAPLRTARCTKPPAPWLTDEIRQMMKKRDSAFRHFKTFPSDLTYRQYTVTRNRTKTLIRDSKREHLGTLTNSLNTKKTWRTLKDMGMGKQQEELTLTDNMTLEDLNSHFLNIPATDPDIISSTIQSILSRPTPSNSFSFSPITTSAVDKAFSRIKSNAVGVDSLSISLLRHIKSSLLLPLTHIINYSFTSNTFPAAWKMAYVHPLPKKKNPTSPNEFRSISILPALSKVIEYLALDQITDFLHLNNILDPFQSGFRSSHSTTTALLNVTEDIRHATDDRHLTLLTMLDFSLAFNSVNHRILLAKLQSIGFSGAAGEWVEQYLSGRQQCVALRKHPPEFSAWKPVPTGVPAGAVLAPLLFSLYISDIYLCIEHCRRHCYADDIQLYLHFLLSNLIQAFNQLNSDLAAIEQWAKNNCLLLNPSKSQILLLGSKRSLSTLNYSDFPTITLSNLAIPIQSTAKNLGLMLSSDLSWGNHVSQTVQKVHGSLHTLRRFKNLMSSDLKKKLIQSLIFPLFDYCDVVYQDVSVEHAGRLQRLQNSCVRFVLNVNFREHITPYFQELNWLKLENRRKFHLLTLTYKILKSQAPNYLFSRFSYLSSSSHNTRNTDLLIPISHSRCLHSSFTITSSRLWNLLPAAIKNSPTIGTYKYVLFKHLLSSQV
jgi:exonuclease III